jgi:hypothetical protein
VCGTGHPFNREWTITENTTVLCSKHEYKDAINEQLSTLPSEVVECHASDTDCSGAPLNKFQIIKLNQSKSARKSAPPEVLKLKCGARVVITRNIGGVVNGTIGTIENIQPNLITVRRLKDNELMCITRIRHYVIVQMLPLRNSFL